MYKKDNILNKLYILTLVAILILAIFLRLKVYLFNVSFWGDESALALNIINRSFLGLLKPLDYTQCAPYGFLILTKLITKLFDTSELVFRFLPFLASILSIPAFYFLSKKVLNKKWSILIANYLFAVNFHLIYYAQEFKQYSIEVLTTLFLLLFIIRLKSEKLTTKQSVFVGLIFLTVFLFSLPSLFVLGAFIVYLVCENKKDSIKQVICMLLPLVAFVIPYYFFCLLPSKKMMLQRFDFLWNPGFIYPDYSSIKELIVKFFNYSFGANFNPLPILIIMFIGFFFFIKYKNKFGIIISAVFFIALAASALHIYPILGRLHLYLIPLMILILVKPFDYPDAKFTSVKIVFVMFFIFTFVWCFRMNFVKNLQKALNPLEYSVSCQKEYMKMINLNSSDDDIFVYTGGDLANYIYYFRYFSIKGDFINARPNKYTYDEFKNVLNKLPKNKAYWFYHEKYHRTSEICASFVKRWSKESENVTILFEFEKQKPENLYILKVWVL